MYKISENITSIEKLKLNYIKTTKNKSFKLKSKVLKLASVTLMKKVTHKIHILEIEQMARGFVKN